MRVFLGDTRAKWMIDQMKRRDWGRMWCDRPNSTWEGEVWTLDNGAYPAWANDTEWYEKKFLMMVDKALVTEGCHLAVIPDKVASSDSLEFSLKWLEDLPPELPWYLAVQDGMESQSGGWGKVCKALEDDRIKGLFLGGSNQFKLTAGLWKTTARMFDKPLHYGRCGTPKKCGHAINCQVDSIDSAFPLWSKERFLYFADVVAGKHPQMELASEWGYLG